MKPLHGQRCKGGFDKHFWRNYLLRRCGKRLVEAFKQIDTDIPIVIRLTGTNEVEGRALLEGSKFHLAETMGKLRAKQ